MGAGSWDRERCHGCSIERAGAETGALDMGEQTGKRRSAGSIPGFCQMWPVNVVFPKRLHLKVGS